MSENTQPERQRRTADPDGTDSERETLTQEGDSEKAAPRLTLLPLFFSLCEPRLSP